jgi:hypothetical protein
MRSVKIALLAGAAALGLAGFARLAEARTPAEHVLSFQLPDGGIEQIRYAGEAVPQVVFIPGPAATPMDVTFPELHWVSPFTLVEQISAAIDAQAAALLRHAEALAGSLPDPSRLIEANFGHLPPGSEGFVFVATTSGNGVCARSVTITTQGKGQPHVVSHSSGNCAAEPGANLPAWQPAAPPHAQQPDTIEVKARPAVPYSGLIHPVAAWQR